MAERSANYGNARYMYRALSVIAGTTVSIYRGVFESEHESLCVLELDARMYGISSVPVKRLPEGETEILLIPDERTEQFF